MRVSLRPHNLKLESSWENKPLWLVKRAWDQNLWCAVSSVSEDTGKILNRKEMQKQEGYGSGQNLRKRKSWKR